MKKRIIIYYIVVILFCIMGIFFYSSTNSNTLEAVSSSADARKDACKEYLNLSDAERKKIDKQYINLYTIEDCNYIINTKDKENSFFLVFESLLDSTLFKFIFPLFVPILLLYPVIYVISSELNSNYPKYFLLRKSYKKYIFHLFRKSYKYIFTVLLILFFLMSYSAIKSNFNFNPKVDIRLSIISDNSLLFYNNIKNCIIYVVVVILNLLSYINIALMVLRTNHKNFLVSYIGSFLIIYFWWCYSFIILGSITDKYFNVPGEGINILEIYTWNGITNVKAFLIANIVFYIGSLLLAILSYRDKEKFLIKCEG